MKRKYFKGITKRWIGNTLGIVMVFLFAVIITSASALHFYFYDSVEMRLRNRANDTVELFFSAYTLGTQEQFETRARNFIENFEERDRISASAIDQNGNVVISSDGFPATNEIMPDYEQAVKNKENMVKWVGRSSTGEKVMALTVLVHNSNGSTVGAVRYVTSLQDIDLQIFSSLMIVCLICLVVFLLVTFSGMFFVKSIVQPVKAVNNTAKEIAQGNFDTRINSHHYNDEIGELCETINYMASELNETNKMKNEFISTISHELRTPLTAIKGWGETLLQVGDTDPELLSKGMNVIIKESGRLTNIVEELLDFSRMQNGKFSLHIQKIDILAELDEAVFAFRDRAMRDGLECVYDVPHIPAPASGDADRIRQVFVNILDNAMKYTEQGGTIMIKAEIVGDFIKIMIGDNGCGIPEEALPHVKEKFYKSNTGVRGSGIGLAVADEIITMHNGTLTVESVLGEGTTVTIMLPIEHDERSTAE